MEEKNPMLNISASPHIRSKNSTTRIMLDVIIALLPASAMGIYNFGFRAFMMILVCVVSCMIFEYLSELIMKRPITVRDLSAVVTGLLLALNVPVDLPYWMAVLGSAFAIIVVKQIFGGIGQNFMNPALAARCFLVMSFVGPMTRFTYDAVTTATPLAVMNESGVGSVGIWKMFLGVEAGTIGETSAAALLIGALYLVMGGVIKVTIPFFYMGSFAVMIAIYGLTQDMGAWEVTRFTAAHLCGGGLVLGACFMATDYTTSPITNKGKMIYGVLLGLLTFCFRIFGSSAEGVSYAIIIGNLLVPIIEMITHPKSFGEGYDKKPMSENKGWLKPVVLDEEGNPLPVPKKIRKESPIRIVVSIVLIALISGALLGGVYAVTKEPIEETAEKKKQESYRQVMKDATDYKESEDLEAQNKYLEEQGFSGVTLNVSVTAMKDGNPIGRIWVITTHEGYAGDIKMAVGIRDGKVTGVEMLSIGETSGLGMEARDNPNFTAQYQDKQVEDFHVVKTEPANDTEIQAITGATITSKAVTNAVNAALAADRMDEQSAPVELKNEGGGDDE